MSSRLGTSNSQISFTAWLCIGLSMPSKSSSHLTLFYNSSRVAPGKTQMGDDIALHHQGNARASARSGQLQTTLYHCHPAPAQLILHGRQNLLVSGHSQSLHLTGLGKSLPLACQQQPSFNYKRKVYSAHTKGTPRIPA